MDAAARPPRANAHKLLLDPYGKAITGDVNWGQPVYPYRFGDEHRLSTSDSARFMPKSVVTNPYFDWGNDRAPNIPLHESVVYELHVRGFTRRHPAVPPNLRGTYAGLAVPEVVDWLLGLGVTAVELMPVHQFVHDHLLARMGLRNYWGYNSICFLAPHHEYSAERQPRTAGAGVQADGAHAARRGHRGDPRRRLQPHRRGQPSRADVSASAGIDNPAYYRLSEADLRYYVDYTGTGNTLNMRHPHVLQLLMDSLRYWVLEMHVDGFRFDLAATLARTLHDVDRLSAFFDVIQQDPVISQVKLIAEPWDVGEGGYQVGNFPPLWSEWNGRYRDTVRDVLAWRGPDARRVRGAVDGLIGSVRGDRPPADRVDQLRDVP